MFSCGVGFGAMRELRLKGWEREEPEAELPRALASALQLCNCVVKGECSLPVLKNSTRSYNVYPFIIVKLEASYKSYKPCSTTALYQPALYG
eukprot:2075355-Rhodomonas_salina.1